MQSISKVSVTIQSRADDSNISDSQLANYVAHTLEFLHHFFKYDEMDAFLSHVRQQYERAGKTQEYAAVIDDVIDVLQGKYTHLPPLPGKPSSPPTRSSRNFVPPADRLPDIFLRSKK